MYSKLNRRSILFVGVIVALFAVGVSLWTLGVSAQQDIASAQPGVASAQDDVWSANNESRDSIVKDKAVARQSFPAHRL